MGDRSPKERDKKKKQHDRELAEANRMKQDRANKAKQEKTPIPEGQRKAG